jgi:hypothetical protein
MLVTNLGENSCSSFDLFRVTTVKQMLVTTLGENVGYFMFCWLQFDTDKQIFWFCFCL